MSIPNNCPENKYLKSFSVENKVENYLKAFVLIK